MADNATLAVTATIAKRSTLQVMASPAHVVVSRADIDRGFVDVPGAAQLTIRSNSADGIAIEITAVADFFAQAFIHGLDTAVQVGPNGGIVMQGAPARGATDVRALRFRLVLARGVEPGIYPWPLRLSIAPA